MTAKQSTNSARNLAEKITAIHQRQFMPAPLPPIAASNTINKMAGKYKGEPSIYIRPGADHSHIKSFSSRWVTEYFDPSSVAVQQKLKTFARPKHAIETDEKVIEYVKKYRKITSTKLVELTGLARPTITNRMNRLEALGIVTKEVVHIPQGGKVHEWSIKT